ncbi:MAG: GPO family capsid scaffolding protein [Alcaligenaceae bacterium]|nr:GPO family capsid scaffolding protein [Alcaligenaceae bacterium]
MKFKSKFFRVATEGATTDGRKIERKWIEQISKNFNPAKYAARVWLEHIRGIMPDSSFRAYGDVLAVEAREVEDGKLALFAQIEPTKDLIEINKNRQKIFTSLEINENFAGTGEAYLIGLGITDTPASLGTEALTFSAQHGTLSGRKQDKDNLFSEAIETSLEFEEVNDAESPSLAEKVKNLFSSLRKKEVDAEKEDFSAAMEPVIQGIVALENNYASLQEELKNRPIKTELETLRQEFSDFRKKMEQTENNSEYRPAATGNNIQLTNC